MPPRSVLKMLRLLLSFRRVFQFAIAFVEEDGERGAG
jgi:hypothetical protein